MHFNGDENFVRNKKLAKSEMDLQEKSAHNGLHAFNSMHMLHLHKKKKQHDYDNVFFFSNLAGLSNRFGSVCLALHTYL
jgi:hypothetical protein